MDTLIEAKPKVRASRRTKPRKELVSIRLDPAILQRADQFANQDKRSFSQYVELALDYYMKEQETLRKYFKPGVVYPIFTPYGEEAAAEKLTELLKRRSV